MKISSQEEYGLRIMLRIARCREDESMSILTLSTQEGLSTAYVAKITRILRQAGYINSTPGNVGGYILARPASEINVNHLLKTLGGALFSKQFCNDYSGTTKFCTNSVDCSARSLWQMIQFSVDQVLDKVTLADLTNSESESSELLKNLIQES